MCGSGCLCAAACLCGIACCLFVTVAIIPKQRRCVGDSLRGNLMLQECVLRLADSVGHFAGRAHVHERAVRVEQFAVTHGVSLKEAEVGCVAPGFPLLGSLERLLRKVIYKVEQCFASCHVVRPFRYYTTGRCLIQRPAV